MLRALALLLLIAAHPAAAEGAPGEAPGEAPALPEGRMILPAMEQDRWNAVGRLNFGDGFCTGTLIEPDLVATAAHCLYGPTGVERLPERVTFVAGYRLGRHAGAARARAFAIHPDYAWSRTPTNVAVASDVALVRLEAPLEGAAPFARGPSPEPDDEVAILSYGRDRPEIPSIQSPCRVTARLASMLVLDCDATLGVSGAPVFRVEGGAARIVGVVSAMAEKHGLKRAFAASLEDGIGRIGGAP